MNIGDDDLLTMHDIAEIIGTSYHYVRCLACGKERSRVPFPDPFTSLGRSKLWLRSDVLRWAIKSKRVDASEYADILPRDGTDNIGTVVHESPPISMDWAGGIFPRPGTVLDEDR